ncbi:hypothetical protein CH333_08430 [candidate division WOR-3 bacterium JGI_Cruoil_03_44_89]|uniref:Fibronectin type-III domain-containing protein n=1 Tax=candidate division WOR-3 bacterium JGI_Cruoil_03_44_89 TaxID=1973748 RepID=A0A235BRT3_UNCW3|nr:MAG: hypothetical protein CH333_08430 [candidate division WOR-3 bacterium JGI_Cruoil_03_44_89]
MKRLMAIAVIPLILLIFGCDEEPEEVLQAPTNLQIEVTGGDNLSIKLTWNASPTTNIDGYVVRLNDVTLDRVTGTQFTHNNPTSLGVYRVRAYRGDDESDAIQVSTELIVRENQGPVWWFDAPSDTGYSAYGWNADGIGNTYSMVGANKDSIDFYMDSVGVGKGTDKIISPDSYPGWGDAHETRFNTTGNTGVDGFTNTKIAPEFGVGAYSNYAEITETGKVYILYLESGHYVKLLVTGRKVSGNHNFTFKYGFQPIAGFRRLGND